MELPTELDARLMTLENALTACFGGFERGNDGYLTVACCGEVSYGSGLMGSDIVECTKCGRSIINVLSPHVSPLLQDGSATHFPTDEFIEAVEDRQWVVMLPKEER